MDAQISVVVLRLERHSPAVILQMELGIVLVVLISQMDVTAGADGDVLAVVCFDLHEIVVQVLERKVAIVADIGVGLEFAVFRMEILPMVNPQETTYATGVFAIARGRSILVGSRAILRRRTSG